MASILVGLQLQQTKCYKLYTYTYATDVRKVNRLNESCAANNVHLTIDGIGSKWQGFQDKLKAFTSFVNQLTETNVEVNPDDAEHAIVMFVDAYDVVITCDETEIIQRFRALNSDIVFQIDSLMFPDPNIQPYFKQIAPPNVTKIYINSGGYIGYLSAMKQMLSSLKSRIIQKTHNDQLQCEDYEGHSFKQFDDQRCFATYFLRNKLDYSIDADLRLALDYKQSIFVLAYGIKSNFVFHNFSNLHHLSNDNQLVCVFHGRGPQGRFVLNQILSEKAQYNEAQLFAHNIFWQSKWGQKLQKLYIWLNHYEEMYSSLDLRKTFCRTFFGEC